MPSSPPAVLADYIQLTPERSAVITADPYHPRRLRLTVSGPAPTGPAPLITGGQPTTPVHVPTRVEVTLQQRIPGLTSDLAWEDAPAGTATLHLSCRSRRVCCAGRAASISPPCPNQANTAC